MHLLLVSGFLGSGKTTLVIELAKASVDRGKRVAVLVNEIGEIGIDGQLMRRLDLNVWELFDGCICCTLAADLVPALEVLDRDYHADLVLLEPSGAADPGNVLRALPYYKGRTLASISSVCVLDSLRLSELYEVITPLICSQITHARLLLVNKADLATPEQVAEACRIATEVNPGASLEVISARQSLSFQLLRKLLPWMK
jgi:G3E family GTPase